MIQEIQINGIPVRYALTSDNIIDVLGTLPSTVGGARLFVRLPTHEQALRVIYRGLVSAHGLSERGFINAYYKGIVHPYKYKNQYPVSLVRYRILERIRQINKEQREQLARALS